MECQEYFISDIVAIDFYKKEDCTLPIPFNVPNLQSMTSVILGECQLHIDMADSEVGIDKAATLKITRARKSAGFIYQHDLDCTIMQGVTSCETSVAALEGSEFIVVTTNGNGDLKLHYPCPGSPTLSLDRSVGEDNDSGAMKVSLNSMSSMIDITLATN